MASCSGNSNASNRFQSSGSEEELQKEMLQRKRKRMQSNRESARRSRMRKQKQMEDLVAQVADLRSHNGEILASINITTQRYRNVEAENSILRAQIAELSQRLQSLNHILSLINTRTASEPQNFLNPINMLLYLNQPIMAFSGEFV